MRLDDMGKTLTQEQYEERLNIKQLDIECIDKYVGMHTKILHRHKKCGYEWMVQPSNILSGYGCPACNGGRCVKGISDINTVNPEMGKLLKNKMDGYNFSEQSNIPLCFICPDCKHEVMMRPADIYRRGFSCKVCGDGISIPNKFMERILLFCNVDYFAEHVFSWALDKRYDFYIPSISATVEVNGIQHYEYSGFKGRTVDEEKHNDELKETLALKNGIKHHIIIDFRYSTFSYMKNSFISSILYDLIDINITDDEFRKIYLNCMKSKMIQSVELWNKGFNVFDIENKLKISTPTVTSYLHKGNEIGLCCYYGVKNLERAVYCLTTCKKFNSIKEASEFYNISQSGIGSCCRKKQGYCGELPNGTKLIWLYFEEYDKMDKDKLENYNPKVNKLQTKVICLNNNQIFESIKDACRWCNKKTPSSITDCCKGINHTSGKHPETNEPLRWMYYKDFLESTAS